MSQEPELYDTVEQARDNLSQGLTRRDVLRTTAVAGTMAAGGSAAAPHVAPRLSPVGRAEAAAPLAGVAVVAAVAVAVSWYESRNLDEQESETLTQAHRNIKSVARALDSADSEEQEFENLVAERSNIWIWEDAVLDFVRGFNDTSSDAPSISDLMTEMEESILSDYADLEQTIVDNQSNEILELVDMFHHLDSYGHSEELERVLMFWRTYNTGTDSFGFTGLDDGWPDSESDSLDKYGLNGDENVLNPFSDHYGETPPTTTDDLVTIDYELVDGTTVETHVGYGDVAFATSNGGFNHHLNFVDDGTPTDISVRTTSHTTRGDVQSFGVPSDLVAESADYGSKYEDDVYPFADASRRAGAISTIRSEANNLASEVEMWVNAIDQEYSRGNLPEADVVSAARLREEYGYEEGSPAITALYGTKLGFDTDLKGTATVVEYASAETEADIEDAEGEELDGYLLLDVEDDVSVDSGETYVIDNLAGEDGAVLMTRPSGETVELEGVIEIAALYSYKDGEQVEVDSMTPESYTFAPRDPNRYEEDLEDTQNAREDATENPEFSLFGGGGIPNLPDIPSWVWLVPGVGVIIAIFVSISGNDRRRRR